MSHKHDLASLVEQEAVRNSTDTEVLVRSALAISSVVVLNVSPSFVNHMVFERVEVAVYAQTNDSNIFAPLFGVLDEHLLIVSHRLLAGRAPSGPEVEKHNLSVVRKVECLPVKAREALDCFDNVTWLEAAFDFDVYITDVLSRISKLS